MSNTSWLLEMVILLTHSDAEKSKKIKELEAAVARLESALHVQNHSLPPPIPPKGLPPSPPRETLSIDSVGPHHTPQPPNHRPPLPYTPKPLRQLQTQACSTPQPPQHPPPEFSQGLPSTSQQTSRLPSSAINKKSLLSVTTVVQNNAELITKEGKMGTIAVALARDSFFGEDVMARCTARGYGDKPGLPLDELMSLKEEVRKLYPNYWNNPVAFEEKWSKCLEAISQACKRIRHKNAKKTKQ